MKRLRASISSNTERSPSSHFRSRFAKHLPFGSHLLQGLPMLRSAGMEGEEGLLYIGVYLLFQCLLLVLQSIAVQLLFSEPGRYAPNRPAAERRRLCRCNCLHCRVAVVPRKAYGRIASSPESGRRAKAQTVPPPPPALLRAACCFSVINRTAGRAVSDCLYSDSVCVISDVGRVSSSIESGGIKAISLSAFINCRKLQNR